jgi:molybdenum cofactor sulfurtransferase
MDTFEALRRREFSRLDRQGHVYLDWTGAGLYAESQVREHAEFLAGSVLGNPHSRNPTSRAATELCDAARERLLRFFNADPAAYEVVFTQNATGALKLVGEAFPFEPGSRLLLTADNHNSVNGVREFAAAGGVAVEYVPLDAGLRFPAVPAQLEGVDPSRPNLFAFPAQSNFSGARHPLGVIGEAARRGWRVLLDAAAFVPTSPLDLSEHAPDFVCVSFYKMLGFPTGIGALVARRDALAELRRPWFAGGTVRFVSAQNRLHLQHVTGRAFEDGTLNYLGIAAVDAGLRFLEGIGIDAVGAHVRRLTAGLLEALHGLRHSDGSPMVRFYGPDGTADRGGAVAFNLLDPAGSLVDFREVEQRCSDALISIRTGFFCNPGAAETAFGYPDHHALRCIRTLTPASFDLQRFSECMCDHAVGAVRASVGIATTAADVERFVEVLRTFRDAASRHGGAPLPSLASVD